MHRKMDTMNTSLAAQAPHLFTVRVWTEVVEDKQTVSRGQVLHVQSGETRYFQNWSALTEHLEAMLDLGRASSVQLGR